jgi:hypothetical protein
MLAPLQFEHGVMQYSPEQAESRREFFRAAARYSLLAAAAAVAALTAGRRAPAGQRCVNRGICRGCGVFAACGLPQALSAKRAGQKG